MLRGRRLWCSAFHHAEGDEAGDLAGEAGVVAGFDDGVDVLVGLGFFLGETPPRATAYEDAVLFEVSAERVGVGVAGGLVAALHPAGAVCGGKEGGVLRHTGQYVGGGAHGAGN